MFHQAFAQDHPHADLLRRKGLAAWLDYDGPAAATGPEIVETCLAGFKRLQPVFDVLGSAFSPDRESEVLEERSQLFVVILQPVCCNQSNPAATGD